MCVVGDGAVSPLSAQGDDLTVVLAMAAADDAQTRRDSLRRIAPRSGTSSEATAASPAAAAAAAASAPASRWISHRSHRQENVAVDHIFFCNPSLQGMRCNAILEGATLFAIRNTLAPCFVCTTLQPHPHPTLPLHVATFILIPTTQIARTPPYSLPPPSQIARTHTSPVEEKIAPIPDWTNLVYREILERIIERYELTSMQVE